MQNKFIPAKKLSISHGNNPKHWRRRWIHGHGSSSEEVFELLQVWWLEIKAKIDVKVLQKTSFSAFLVFKLDDSSMNLEKATASIRYAEEITDSKLEEGYIIFLDKKRNRPDEEGRFPQLRSDGWMEIKLGEFSNKLEDKGKVEIRLRENNTKNKKSGLVVRGIDLRHNFSCDCDEGSSEPAFLDCVPCYWQEA